MYRLVRHRYKALSSRSALWETRASPLRRQHREISHCCGLDRPSAPSSSTETCCDAPDPCWNVVGTTLSAGLLNWITYRARRPSEVTTRILAQRRRAQGPEAAGGKRDALAFASPSARRPLAESRYTRRAGRNRPDSSRDGGSHEERTRPPASSRVRTTCRLPRAAPLGERPGFNARSRAYAWRACSRMAPSARISTGRSFPGDVRRPEQMPPSVQPAVASRPRSQPPVCSHRPAPIWEQRGGQPMPHPHQRHPHPNQTGDRPRRARPCRLACGGWGAERRRRDTGAGVGSTGQRQTSLVLPCEKGRLHSSPTPGFIGLGVVRERCAGWALMMGVTATMQPPCR